MTIRKATISHFCPATLSIFYKCRNVRSVVSL